MKHYIPIVKLDLDDDGYPSPFYDALRYHGYDVIKGNYNDIVVVYQD